MPQNTLSQFPSPPMPPSEKTMPQAFVEYITAFDKPLTKDEKVAWLGDIAHRVLSGELPQEVYPFLRDKIESLPEALPHPNRNEEKIPGSDYIHPEGSKPYVPLIRENPTFISDDLTIKKTTRRSKENTVSYKFLSWLTGFLIICCIAYAYGVWFMKTPLMKIEKAGMEVIPISVDSKPAIIQEIMTDNPFEEIGTDNPFEEPNVAIVVLKELPKEVLRITLKLSDTEKCSYKIEKTKIPLPEKFEGRPIRLFPNTSSWRDKSGNMTTIHNFEKPNILDDVFLPREAGAVERVSLDKSSGHFTMRYGPKSWADGVCRTIYKKKTSLPIVIVADIIDPDYFKDVFTSDIWFSIYADEEATLRERLRFGFNGRRAYVHAKLSGGLRLKTPQSPYPTTGYSGNSYVENFSKEGDDCIFELLIHENEFYNLDFISASFSGTRKTNTVFLDEKRIGDVVVESDSFAASVLENVFLSKGEHRIKLANNWGWIALDKLVIRPSIQTTQETTDNPFEKNIATDNPFVE